MMDYIQPKISSTILKLGGFHQVFPLPDPEICYSDFPELQDIISDCWSGRGYLKHMYISNNLDKYKQVLVQVKGIIDVGSIRAIHKLIEMILERNLLNQTKAIRFSKPLTHDKRIGLINSNVPASRNVIAKMGVELEGGWMEHPKHHQVYRDGSVRFDVLTNYFGEIRTLPASPLDFPWEEELFDDYPLMVNSSCGMHVHYSFPSLGMYNAYVNSAFSSWLISKLRIWMDKHTDGNDDFVWMERRLSGKNHYCVPSFYNPTAQLLSARNDYNRYAAVNYCYTKHRTMEIRVLPMFITAKKAKAAIIELTRLVNLWGDQMGPKPRHGVVLYEAKNYYAR